MTQRSKRIMSAALTLLMVLSVLVVGLPTDVFAASGTGYTTSGDVEYKTEGKYTANWGYPGEDCTFLSPYANGFYTSDYSFETLSKLKGGNSQGTAPQSELYEALQNLMDSKHTTLNSYGETKTLFRYTDCQMNDYSTILSFYSGGAFDNTWDSGKTWNREHAWPSSKCLHPGHSDNTRDESTDIMMLRPTLASENGNRGNKGYGESSDYYNPNSVTKVNEDHDVRGDCARIFLYMYVRWGITDGNGRQDKNGNNYTTWGKYGVMENMEVLLKWMEEDPVDTWEMGRNDAVQSITGTRNVFVDYPEYAWLLFGQNVPAGMTTPSQNGSDGVTANPGDYEDNGSGSGSDSDTVNVNWVTTPNADTAYQLAYIQNNKDGKAYYFDGTLFSNGFFLNTTTDASKAKDIYLETVSNGYRIYFKDGSTTKYLRVYANGTHVNAGIGTSEEASVFTWDNADSTFVTTVNGTKYFLGTYDSYTTISACEYEKYINSNIVAKPCSEKTSGDSAGGSTGGDSNGSTTTPTNPTPTTPTPTTPAPTESTPNTTPSTTEPDQTVTDPTETQPSTDVTDPTDTAPTDPTQATEETEPSETTKPTDPATPDVTEPTPSAPVSGNEEDSSSSAIVVVCIVIAVLAIGGVVIYIIKKRSNRCE